MTTITRIFEWDMGHRVTNHESLCKNPHGHRYKMEATIAGPLIARTDDPQEGMIIDFGHIKSIINTSVIDKLDHAFMYWQKDPVMRKFAYNNAELKLIEVPFVPTAERIVGHIAKDVQIALRKNYETISLEKLVLYETPNCWATWTAENNE